MSSAPGTIDDPIARLAEQLERLSEAHLKLSEHTANLIPIVFVRRIVSGAAFPVGGFASFQGIVVNAGSAHEVVAHGLGLIECM